MKTDLVVTNIPKEEVDIKCILKALGDYTWSEEGIGTWIDDSIGVIYYSSRHGSYIWSSLNLVPIGMKQITYKECLKCT